MKILHVYDGHERVFLGEGSTPSIVYYLSKYASCMGHEVTVLERLWLGTTEKEVLDGIKFVRFKSNICSNISNKELPHSIIENPFKLIRFVMDRTLLSLKFNEYINKEKYDIIHFHVPFASNIILNINKKARNFSVYTAHIGEEKKRFGLDPSAPFLLKITSPDLHLIRRVKKVVVLNENIKNILANKGVNINKLEIIPNGIEISKYIAGNDEICKIRKKYELDKYDTIIMFAGSITRRKGIHYLIKAAEKVLSKYRNIMFLCVGELTPEKYFAQNIIEYIKQNKLDRYIKFTGFIPYDDLRLLYSACDMFVFPSLEEGDPVALKEALAAGRPLVGSNVGGIPMQIRDGWNGFLIEPGNVQQIVDRVEYLIDNDNDRRRMGKNSRKLAKKFDWKVITSHYINLYKRILDNAGW